MGVTDRAKSGTFAVLASAALFGTTGTVLVNAPDGADAPGSPEASRLVSALHRHLLNYARMNQQPLVGSTRKDDPGGFASSPVIGRNRLYVGNRQGRVVAIGGC